MGFETPTTPSNNRPDENDRSSKPEYSGDILERYRELKRLAESSDVTEDERIELRMTQSVLDAEKTGRTRMLKPDLMDRLAILKENNERNRTK